MNSQPSSALAHYLINFFTKHTDCKLQAAGIIQQQIEVILHIINPEIQFEPTQTRLATISQILYPYFEKSDNFPYDEYPFEFDRDINFVDSVPKIATNIKEFQELGIKNASNPTAFANRHIQKFGFDNMQEYYISTYVYYLFFYLMFVELLSEHTLSKSNSDTLSSSRKAKIALKYVDNISLCMSELTSAFETVKKYQQTHKGGKLRNATNEQISNNIKRILSGMRLTSEQKQCEIGFIIAELRKEYQQLYGQPIPFKRQTLEKLIYDSH